MAIKFFNNENCERFGFAKVDAIFILSIMERI